MRIDDLTTDAAILAEIGHRLSRLRLERNWTQEQLARQAGVGKATVQRAERGSSVEVTSLVRLLRALDLLAALDSALPAAEVLPLAELERERRRGRRRVRARPQQPPADDGKPWRWGDERLDEP